jgi:hypothetical protein
MPMMNTWEEKSADLFIQNMNIRINIGLSYFWFKVLVTNGIRDKKGLTEQLVQGMIKVTFQSSSYTGFTKN